MKPLTGSVLGTHRTLTAGISVGYRPSATMAGTLSKKLKLDLGHEVVMIALGDAPLGSLHALHDDLGKLLEDSK